MKKADREKEKQEAMTMYSKPSYEVPGYRQARHSPQTNKRYSTYSPKSERFSTVRSPLAQEERYSPGRQQEGAGGNRGAGGGSLGRGRGGGEGSPGVPLAQEERVSPGPEERLSQAVPSRNSSVGVGAAVIYAHRKDAGQRPRSLHFQPPVKRE